MGYTWSMREIFHLGGKRQRVDNIDEALRVVRESYPGAHKQGSLGAWCFFHPTCEDKNMVAEAWMIQSKKSGWWLVVKPRQENQ